MLLYYLPKNTTEAVQVINYGYWCLLRCKIGHVLDIWLTNKENLSKREGKMTAVERKILVTKLVSYAQEEILKEENHG